jgi:DNA-directed RNA polymerase specialized sigma24 family protein
VDLRDALVRILLRLPSRQRTVLVLRYWEQLTEAATAAALGWPEGTVKPADSRGLRCLRELADGWQETELHGAGLPETGLLTHTEPFRISRAIATRTGS